MKIQNVADQFNATRLSALLDGELAEEELGQVLQAMEQDPQLREFWHQMCLVRQKLGPAGSQAGVEICDSVMEALRRESLEPTHQEADLLAFLNPAPEPGHSQPVATQGRLNSGVTWLRLGMAAGIAAFGVVMWNLGGQMSSSPGSPAGLAVASLVSDAPMANTPVADVSVANVPVADLIRAKQVEDTQQVVELAAKAVRVSNADWQTFESYWMVHSVQAGNMGSNVVSFGRVVDPDVMPKPLVVKVTR